MMEYEVVDKFKADNHFRMADKCCSNCKFGEDDYEGCAICHHPSLDFTDDDGEQDHAHLGAYQEDVCDLWELNPAKEDHKA